MSDCPNAWVAEDPTQPGTAFAVCDADPTYADDAAEEIVITTYAWDEIESFTRARTDEYAAGQIAKLADDRIQWFAAWPTGIRYCTRCLDGGAWDRSTNWGMFATLCEPNPKRSAMAT